MASPHYEDGGLSLFHGKSEEVLRGFPDAHFDSVVCDPPYELTANKKGGTGVASLNPNSPAGRSRIGTGFMGKSWDGSGIAFSVDLWTEVLRVLKPGGHLLAFGGTRTFHRMATAIEDSGFEIRDSIAWLYGQGFPKNPGVLKPAFEPIVVARAPFKGTARGNVAEHGTGALFIDANRVPATDSQLAEKYASVQGAGTRSNTVYGTDTRSREGSAPHEGGRWPTNVLMDGSQADSLDAQSGFQKDGVAVHRNLELGSDKPGRVAAIGLKNHTNEDITYGSGGGASRYFPTFRYEAKANSSERPEVDGFQHPTVKPLELMQWLVRLVTPAGGRVLDHFAGSGTTGEAALLEGMECVLIEMEADHLPLILQRVRKPLQQALIGDIA